MNIQQIAADYERDGCVRVRAMLKPDELQQVRRELDRFIREKLPQLPAGDRTFEPDGITVRNLWRLERYDPFFDALSKRPDVLELVGVLVHGRPVLHAVETFNKPARVGSGVPPHQDNAYFCQVPPDMLTVWIALDAATEQNGPIYYLKGSHRQGVLPHRPSGVAGNSMGLIKMPAHSDAELLVGTLEPGDALIHHCQTIHYSAPNKTDRPRCGLLMVYQGEHTQTDAKLKAEYDRARPRA